METNLPTNRSKRSFPNNGIDDYKKYLKPHMIYVVILKNNITGQRVAKLGVTSWNVTYRFLSDREEWTVMQSWEFNTRNGIEAFGVENIILHEITAKYKNPMSEEDQKKYYLVGKEELFGEEHIPTVLNEIVKCRQELGLTYSIWMDYPTDYVHQKFE